MYKLIIAERAHQDLDSIISYIAVQLSNPKAAGELLDEVAKCYGYLKNNPKMYEKCQDQRLEAQGYRKALIKNYVLVFKITDTTQTVSILRFFYGAQDYIKLI